jgi:polyphosphate kinase
VAAQAHALIDDQYRAFNDEVMPALQREGIHVLNHADRNEAQRRWVDQFFQRQVRPLLVPVGLDPSHPFPQVANKSLNFIVRLGGQDAFGRENEIGIVKVPRVLPRLIRMPDKVAGRRTLLVSLSSIIRAHLDLLFHGREVGQFSQFRVTRHSELALGEEEVRNLRTALRLGLQQRHYGQAVRLEVSAGCSEYLSSFLLRQFGLPAPALYRVHGPVNLARLQQAIDLVDAPRLLFPAYQASYPRQLVPGRPIFEQLRKHDVLIHQPFESFEGVLDFLREAVRDPQVLAIKQTIYRTGADAEMADLLREAVRRGKEVTAVVELKARFDEEANINWAEGLEAVGAQVVYGVVGLKTHAKMLLVTRRENDGLVRYAHLSTGNYNPRTARLYTDLSHLTADPLLTSDIEQVFIHLAGQSKLPKLNHILLAPFQLQKKLIEQVESVGAAAAAGLPARIALKMNALTDEPLMRALVAAGRRGAKVDLVIRGACMLPAGVPGLTENIRVRSIIGRFLEHTRIFLFRAGEAEELYLSSADWMNRNMLRRVELAWPVKDAALRKRVIEEGLALYLDDHRDAWDLQPEGNYRRAEAAEDPKKRGAQALLMERYGTVDGREVRART